MPETPTILDARTLSDAAGPRGLRSFGLVRGRTGIDEAKRTVEVIASTRNVARDHAVIDQRGWELDNYARNPVVLWAHDDTRMPIARTIESRIENDQLIQVHQFATHPEAEHAFQAIVGGFINAVSVRWIPLDARIELIDGQETLVFARQELLETSYVPIPADPYALVQRADGGRFDVARLLTPPEPAPADVAARTDADSTLADARIDAINARIDGLITLVEQRLPARTEDADPLIPEPAPETDPDEVVVSEAAERAIGAAVAVLNQAAARLATPPDYSGMFAAVLARATGRSEERIRADFGSIVGG